MIIRLGNRLYRAFVGDERRPSTNASHIDLGPKDVDCYYWSVLHWTKFTKANCAGPRKVYKGHRYCTLHYPGRNIESFEEVLEQKIEDGDFDFRGVQFPYVFSRQRGFVFNAEVDFQDAYFRHGVRLKKGSFQKNVDFRGATFEGGVDLQETEFAGSVDLSKANFLKKADFSNAKFESSVYFSSATFKAEAVFSEATFSDAHFLETSFEESVDFFKAVFFDRVAFYGSDKTKVFNDQKHVDFRHVQIYQPGNFSFHVTALRPSWFINVPELRNLAFTNIKGWDRNLKEETRALEPLSRKRFGKEVPLKDRYPLLGETYKELAANAEEARLYADANKFHYWSMEALRKANLARRFNPITFFHWALSGYGNRPFRALIMLSGMYLAFAAVFYLWVGSAQGSDCNFVAFDHFWQALGYSLGAMTLQLQDSLECATREAAIVAYVAGVLGPVQIALLTLAVRRRFMR